MALAWLYVVLRIAHSLVFALPFLWRFVERLYGELPALFKDEDELRALWSLPETERSFWRRWIPGWMVGDGGTRLTPGPWAD